MASDKGEPGAGQPGATNRFCRGGGAVGTGEQSLSMCRPPEIVKILSESKQEVQGGKAQCKRGRCEGGQMAPVRVRVISSPGLNRSFGRSPSRWISNNYAVREKYVADMVTRLKFHPEVDAFATQQNTRCVRWWGKESKETEDAFNQSWQGISLWINPPFNKIGDVVKKVAEDGAHAILVVPGWVRRKWHRAAAAMAIRRAIYPRGTRLFERNGEVCRGCPWPVTAFLLCGHKTRCEGGKMEKVPGHVRFGLRSTSPPPGTRGALGAEGVRRAHLGQILGVLKSKSSVERIGGQPGPNLRRDEVAPC